MERRGRLVKSGVNCKLAQEGVGKSGVCVGSQSGSPFDGWKRATCLF